LATTWSPFDCDATADWWACRACRNGWWCDKAEARQQTALRAFSRLLARQSTRRPLDGWWSEFDRIQPWATVLRPDTWAHVARRVIHQMVSAAARRRHKRRAFVQALAS
jgi:hypothetical protein